jgi:hypothetical protein
MKKYLKIHFLAIAVTMMAASCNSSPEKVPSEGDSGDSATLGAGPDTTGVTVDTGSTVTDTASVTDSVY